MKVPFGEVSGLPPSSPYVNQHIGPIQVYCEARWKPAFRSAACRASVSTLVETSGPSVGPPNSVIQIFLALSPCAIMILRECSMRSQPFVIPYGAVREVLGLKTHTGSVGAHGRCGVEYGW